MKVKVEDVKKVITILITLAGLAILTLSLHALIWAPMLISSVSWNA